MRACLRWVALGGLMLGALFRAGGASADGLQAHIDAVNIAGLPSVTATVTVTDSAGLPIADLPATAFTATVDGAPAPLAAVGGAADQNLGIAVVLTFDTSGSMLGPPLEQAKSAARALVSQLGPADQAAVIAFANDVRLAQPFTADKQALLDAINSLTAGGNTALYEAVRASYDTLSQAGAPRKAVVLLSDGQDFGAVSQTDRAASLAAAGAPGVATFLVALGQSVDQPYLEELRAASHGRLMQAPDPAALEGLYQVIGALLRHQYVLTLDISGIQGGPDSVLRVDVAAAGGTAFAEAALNLPAPPPPPVTPAPTPVPTPVPQPQAEPSGGGASWLLPAVIGGVAVAGAGGFVLVRRRRRRRAVRPGEAVEESLDRLNAPPPPPREDAGAPLFPAGRPAEIRESDSWLTLSDGDRFPLGESPVTIGFTADCDVQLPDRAGAVAAERVRIWQRDGRYMLHTLSRLGRVSVGGKPAAWVILEDGDEIQLGPHTITFRSPS